MHVDSDVFCAVSIIFMIGTVVDSLLRPTLFYLTSLDVFSVSEDGVSNPPRVSASTRQMALLVSTGRTTGKKIGQNFTCNKCAPYDILAQLHPDTNTDDRRVAGIHLR